jgi:glycosyltransferase involved in cell wall biosynthesis
MFHDSDAAKPTKARILSVSSTEFGGGAESSAWNLYKRYQRLGHDSWLAVGAKSSRDPNVFVVPNAARRNAWVRGWRRLQLRGKGTRAEKLTHVLGKLARLGEPRRTLHYMQGIEDFHYPGTAELLSLAPQRPTIVHCHNLHGNYFDLRAICRLSAELPVIVNLRDAWMLTGHCAHSLGCERWKFGCGACPDLTIQPSIQRDGTSYNWSRKARIYASSRLYVCTPSQWLMDKVHESMLSGALYKVIPNGVDIDVFRPGNQSDARCRVSLPQDGQVVLLTGHNEFKDVEKSKYALSLLTSSEGESLTFVCLGVSAAEHILGRGRMIYRPFVHDPKDLVSYYQAADAYLHVAKAEVFGKSIVEAMACGTPPVATAVGGVPEVIQHMVTGILVPPNDVGQLAEGLSRVLRDQPLRNRIAVEGLAHARAHFSIDGQAASFLAWYSEVIDDWAQWKLSLS